MDTQTDGQTDRYVAPIPISEKRAKLEQKIFGTQYGKKQTN